MIHLASTLIAMGDEPSRQALADALSACDYLVTTCSDGARVKASLADQRPDILIVGPGLQTLDIEDLIRQVRQDTATQDLPIFVLSPTPVSVCGDQLLDLGVDDAADWPTLASEIAQRLRPTLRVSTMRTELAIRQSVAAGNTESQNASTLAPDPATAGDDTAPAILVIGCEALTVAIRDALHDEGTPPAISQCQDLFEAQRMLEDRRFDACVIEGGDDPEATVDLCLQIRRNPRLFNLPVLYVLDKDQAEDRSRILQRGASQVLASPLSPVALRFHLKTLVTRQRSRWALRQGLSATRTTKTAEPNLRESYCEDFVLRYLEARVTADRTRQRQFSLIGFAFAGVDAIRHEFGPEAEHHLIDQISQWLALLVRAEDMVGYLGHGHFCVTLPDTTVREAEIVMHRIAGVISNTDFAVADVYRVVNVWPYVHATGLTSGASARSLMMDLKQGFNKITDFG